MHNWTLNFERTILGRIEGKVSQANLRSHQVVSNMFAGHFRSVIVETSLSIAPLRFRLQKSKQEQS